MNTESLQQQQVISGALQASALFNIFRWKREKL